MHSTKRVLELGGDGSRTPPKVSLWLEDAVAAAAFAALLAFVPLVLSLDKPAIDPLAEDMSWYRRHERQSAECRGHQYIAQCCENARTDISCIDAEIKEKK